MGDVEEEEEVSRCCFCYCWLCSLLVGSLLVLGFSSFIFFVGDGRGNRYHVSTTLPTPPPPALSRSLTVNIDFTRVFPAFSAALFEYSRFNRRRIRLSLRLAVIRGSATGNRALAVNIWIVGFFGNWLQRCRFRYNCEILNINSTNFPPPPFSFSSLVPIDGKTGNCGVELPAPYFRLVVDFPSRFLLIHFSFRLFIFDWIKWTGVQSNVGHSPAVNDFVYRFLLVCVVYFYILVFVFRLSIFDSINGRTYFLIKSN